MTKIFTAGVLLFVITCFAGCKKDDKITDNFKCKVNGKVWRPGNTDFKYGHAAEAHLIDDGKTFFVTAYQEGSRQSITISIFLGTNVEPGTYYFKNSTHSAVLVDPSNDLKFVTQQGYDGSIEIVSLDKGSKTVTGRFSFKALDTETNNVAEVTDGQFNLQYYPY
ncbi:DUF6252 family protein [Pedobacter endophyticus]|uniref:Uncharacterized protein n=1 Tax=Pedobacter endophyticus TaxID=2789740 RepID=A0A7S9KY64_9SPHI|nr:DUF6252 family protein [Pedobacter endophyticus]QPH39002.1 hypothetical protein IZT61_18355 [Pedobacter endophyticus]